MIKKSQKEDRITQNGWRFADSLVRHSIVRNSMNLKANHDSGLNTKEHKSTTFTQYSNVA